MTLLASLILIVDIENLKISPTLEQAIANAFGGVAMLKIAIGNWKILKNDRELHDRGYYLFHSPQGKDAADLEICHSIDLLSDGTKIVIVSNDKIFIDRATRSREIEDKSIYIVRKYLSKYFLSEWMLLLDEQEVKVDPAPQQIFVEHDSIEFTNEQELVIELKRLIEQNQITALNMLGHQFKTIHGIAVKEVIKALKIDQTFDKFVVNRQILSIQPKAAKSSQKNTVAKLDRSTLIDKIKALILARPQLAKDACKFCYYWNQTNGISLSEQMKQAGITGKPGTLLAKLNSDPNIELK